MKNAWDVTPIPLHGAKGNTAIAAAKGVSVSEWEIFEVELAEVYSAMIGMPYRSRDAFKFYGEPSNFKSRLDELEKVAEKYFQTNCNQGFESRFCELARLSRNFAPRRNEIVHSCIRPVIVPGSGAYGTDPYGSIPYNGRRFTLFLVPPLYQDKKYDENNKPNFLYGPQEIDYYTDCFRWMTSLALTLVALLRNLGTPPFP